jgi:hypothetical protein
MATVVDFVLLGAVIGIHTLLAAVLTRFFRIRLDTQWGAGLYSVVLIPVVLVVGTLFFTGALGIGGGITVQSRVLLLAALIGLPMALGITIDFLYMAPPEEYELPEPTE